MVRDKLVVETNSLKGLGKRQRKRKKKYKKLAGAPDSRLAQCASTLDFRAPLVLNCLHHPVRIDDERFTRTLPCTGPGSPHTREGGECVNASVKNSPATIGLTLASCLCQSQAIERRSLAHHFFCFLLPFLFLVLQQLPAWMSISTSLEDTRCTMGERVVFHTERKVLRRSVSLAQLNGEQYNKWPQGGLEER